MPSNIEVKVTTGPVDVIVTNLGTIFTFDALTPAARAWVAEHVQREGYMRLGANGFACEHRFARDIAQGMIDAGLEVR